MSEKEQPGGGEESEPKSSTAHEEWWDKDDSLLTKEQRSERFIAGHQGEFTNAEVEQHVQDLRQHALDLYRDIQVVRGMMRKNNELASLFGVNLDSREVDEKLEQTNQLLSEVLGQVSLAERGYDRSYNKYPESPTNYEGVAEIAYEEDQKRKEEDPPKDDGSPDTNQPEEPKSDSSDEASAKSDEPKEETK